MDLPTAIATAARTTRRIVENTATADPEGRTPCSEFSLADLEAHMSGFAPMSIAAVSRAAFVPGEPHADGWRERYLADLDAIGAAWAAPDALEGTVQFGGGDMPAAQAASITVLELLVHGWDLARATGQTYSVDGELADLLYGIVAAGRPAGTESGFFGPEVTPEEDATTFERALALSGRDPGWTAR